MNSPRILAGIALVLAFCVWGAVGYGYRAIQDARSVYMQELADAATQSGQITGSAKLRQFVASNQGRAQALDVLVPADLSVITEAIISVGQAAGTTVHIADVLPITPTTKGNTEEVRTIAYTVDSSGSYTAMMRTLALFDTLALPSKVTTVDLYQDKTLWQLRVRIEVLTSAPISS